LYICGMNNANNNKMKVTRIIKGVYKVIDINGTWIAKQVFASDSSQSYWCAWSCENSEDTSCENSWAVAYPTFKALKQFAQRTPKY